MGQFLLGVGLLLLGGFLLWFGGQLATEGWTKWRHPESILQSQAPKELKLKQPTFSEKVDTVLFSLGEGGITVGYKFSVLEKEAKEPFKLGGFSPVRLYIENAKPFADVKIYGGSGMPPIEIKHNQILNKPPNWDFNSNENALEIVNENQIPVYQLYYKTTSHIVINGIFPFPGGVILANKSGATMNPILPTTFGLKRIFRYPSWKYPGQYEENDKRSQLGVMLTFKK